MINPEKIYIFAIQNAQVAELVDALDSKSSSFESVGSIPTLSTQIIKDTQIVCLLCLN